MMKNFILVAFAAFASVMAVVGTAQAQQSFIYFDGTLAQLERRATNGGKPYFLFFDTDQSQSAHRLAEETFKNRELVAYAQENYIGYKADGRSYGSEGRFLAQQLSLDFLPAIVVFNKDGKEESRHYGFTPPQKLLEVLKENRNRSGEPEQLLSSIPRPADGYDDGYDPKIDGYLYRVSAKRQPMNGFGVQVGAFTFYHHAFKKLLRLTEELGYSNIMLFARPVKGEFVYKLLVGPFPDQGEAADALVKLRKKDGQIEGVVVDLSVIE